MSASWTWTVSKLKCEDWDFRPEVCREDDLESCSSYEYSREATAFRNAVADSRRRNPDYGQKLNHPLAELMVSPSTKSSSPRGTLVDALTKPPVPLAYRIHPQWPETPFGLLRRPSRKLEPGRTFALSQEDIGGFVRKLLGRPDFLDLPKTIWDPESNSETIMLRIPWNFNNDQLRKRFDQWLKDNRPQGKEGDSRPKVEGFKSPTGAGSRPRQIRSSLKALGAYRLLFSYKGNRTKARQHTDVLKILGKDFYNNETAWTGAKQVALYGIERCSRTLQTQLTLEKFRLKWETDEKFRQDFDKLGEASTEKR